MPQAAKPLSTPLTRKECGEAGMLVRLATEDWSAMMAAAHASPEHVSNLDRWRRIAKERNPRLNDEQTERLAGYLKLEHYRRMSRLSAQARRLARDAKAELDNAGGAA